MIQFDNVSHLEIDIRRWEGTIKFVCDGEVHKYYIRMESGDGMWMMSQEELEDED